MTPYRAGRSAHTAESTTKYKVMHHAHTVLHVHVSQPPFTQVAPRFPQDLLFVGGPVRLCNPQNTARSRCRWSVSGGRACGTVCVYHEPVVMVRPNGSSASAIARQRGFRLPLLIKMFSNQSCGNKHMDMLNLLLG